jgi:hypothetical protein
MMLTATTLSTPVTSTASAALMFPVLSTAPMSRIASTD